MRMKSCLALCALVIFTLQGSVGLAETWKAACERNVPPYNFIDESGDEVGLDTEIVRAVMEEIGIDLEIDTVSWVQVMNLLDSNKVDFGYQFVGKPERFEKYNMVGPFRYGRTVFVVRKDSDITTYKDLKDLKDYKIGIVKGYAYTSEFDSAEYLTKVENNNNDDLIQSLVNGSVDIIVGDMQTLIYIARNQENYGDIRFIDKVLRVVARYVAFSKNRTYEAAKFEDGLEAIKKKGICDKILMEWQ